MDLLDIYRTKDGLWRWRLRAANYRVIAASTEEYWGRNKCIANASRVLDVDLFVESNGLVIGRMSGPPIHVYIRGKR